MIRFHLFYAIQFIVAYANYSLDCWWCLLSPVTLSSIDGAGMANWATYETSFTSTDMPTRKRLQKIAQSAWDSFTSTHEPANVAFISDSIFSAVDSFTKSILDSPSYFGAAGDPTWDSLIKTYNETMSTDLEPLIGEIDEVSSLDIKLALDRKLEWMAFPHGGFHYAPPLPLVTPKVLDCVAQVFQQVPNALTEVRI